MIDYQKVCEDILKTLGELENTYNGRQGNDAFSWGVKHGITMSKRVIKTIIESEEKRRNAEITNLEKWKQKILEAKDGSDFLYILKQMNNEISWTQYCQCEECKAKWFDKKAEK